MAAILRLVTRVKPKWYHNLPKLEENRPGPTPLYGLIILGLAALFLEFLASWDGLSTCSPWEQEIGRGNCVYQAFQDEECLGTVFLKQPASIPGILESIGLPQPGKCAGPQEKLPCNRAIRLGRDLRVISIEKIRGTQLISAGRRIDVNSADLEDLTAVPGIGPRLAERIIGQRELQGRFSGIEELERIHGIGKKKLAGWIPYIEAGNSGVADNRLQNVQTSGSLLEPPGPIQE
jgi:competence ComEA-like helix-hairpin-helix protein